MIMSVIAKTLKPWNYSLSAVRVKRWRRLSKAIWEHQRLFCVIAPGISTVLDLDVETRAKFAAYIKEFAQDALRFV
jgi:hypothetical protein